MGESAGSLLELDVVTLAHGGVAVARHDGRVVFVGDAIPGERVLARVTDDSKRAFWRADTVEVLRASPYRRPHIWPAASLEHDPDTRAGGAELGHIELAHQRVLKAEVLTDALRRMAHLERAVEVRAVPGDDERAGTGWRTRMRLQVGADGRLGPFSARSHTVVPVSGLPLATPELEHAARLGEPVPHGVHAVELVQPATGPVRRILLPAREANGQRGPRDRPGSPRPRRVRATLHGAGGRDAASDRAATSPTIVERVRDREFVLDEAGFWQVHERAAETLRDAVRDAVDLALLDPDAPNLDLYGGVGLLAAALGSTAAGRFRITTVEGDRAASCHAASNLTHLGRAHAVSARVESYLADLHRTASAADRAAFARATVVLDPPRSGAGFAVVDALAELRPAQLVYVACDPVALARDVGRLAGQGYEPVSLSAFDLFPNTHHLEAVAAFRHATRS